ncbi:sulfurtransferase-like selenium metabolism protein YedF [Campylobacter mucosalis]|uniref:Selenium metabolism protein n=1 Tax=Campylobacter mucosalis CCUG 21559 TaxID=1032067 RepID=A0A6G5QFW3_9BACT|nr:sulfurtransferase-like selenium metabolism protein YedF [Campylobacter mucosalis]QCD44541.1 selenium metabolism protein [Campylobacter mucosalis CCUG 21559]
MQRLDCRNLECPEPVIRTKNALNELKDAQKLEILVNSQAPRENISRFLNSQNQNFTIKDLPNGETLFEVSKSGVLAEVNTDDFVCNTLSKKVIFLNEDRTGSGEVGVGLLAKFLGAFLQVENKPYAVLLVNNAVRLSTDRAQPAFKALKDLEALGVKILSCGSCLEAYKLVDKLGVGEMTNAFEIADILSKYDEIKL